MKNVLVVGHCNLDHPRIASLVEDNFQAKAIRVEKLGDTIKFLDEGPYDLAIINRIGAFDQESGIELIKEIKNRGRSDTPLMLVTNYKDQMELSVKHGGVQGFGKDAMTESSTIAILEKYLA